MGKITCFNINIYNYLYRSKDKAYTATFNIDTHTCSLIQYGEGYELRVDNQSFNHVMDLERNKKHFGGNDPTTTEIKSGAVSGIEKPKFGFGNIQTKKK